MMPTHHEKKVPHVVVPAILMDLVPRYLENRKAELEALHNALSTSDFDSIRNIAHKLKGNAASYGFMELTDLGSVMEKAAVAKDAKVIEDSLQTYADYLNQVQVTSGS